MKTEKTQYFSINLQRKKENCTFHCNILTRCCIILSTLRLNFCENNIKNKKIYIIFGIAV